MRKFLFFMVAVLMLTSSNYALAQQTVIDGKVLSNTGAALSGATVKSGNISALTGGNGEFSIRVAVGASLTVSYVGYTDAKVSAAKGMTVTLQPSTSALDEVIVTGVASATSKKKMTVSVTRVGEERLSAVPAVSAAGALVGKVAGARVSMGSGSPGAGVDILLRGDNNLGIGSSPLILVDGVILDGSLADINVDDIEAMEVVRGAAASALYGSRAANGVIAIVSKRGNKLDIGSSKVTVRNEVGFQQIANYIDLAENHAFELASDYATQKAYTKYAGVTYPANYAGGYNPGIVGSRKIAADHYLDNPFGVTRDLQKEFFGTGTNMTNYVAVSSRYAKTNMFASFENNKQTGIVQNTNGYARQNFRLNLDHQIAPWLKLSATNLVINTRTQYPGDGGGIFFNIVLAEPDNDLFMANPVDGQPYYLRHNHWSNERNPLYSTWKNKRDDVSQRWIGNYSANVKFTKWASLDLAHTIESNNYHYTSYNPFDTWTVGNGGGNAYGIVYTKGSLYKYFDHTMNQNTQATLNIAPKKYKDLSVKGKLSYLFEDKFYESFDVSSSQFAVRDLPTMENFTTIRDAGSQKQTIRARNYFGVISFDYKDRYLLDAMYRYDGSSLFGADAKWASYYRVSGAYRLSEDVKIPGVDEFKIRAAHGTAGLRPGFNWQYETYNISNGVTSPGQKGNKNLRPSQTAETEFGIDVDFLKKFNLQVNYAKSITEDQFLNVPLIPFVNDGFTSQFQNAGTVESKTLEITLGANWVKTKNFSWNTNVVFGQTKTVITELPVPSYQSGPDGLFFIKKGETYGAIYGYDWVRSLDQMSKQLPAGKSIADYEVNNEGYVIPKGTAGSLNEKPIKLTDANGALAFVKMGSGLPDFTMGISNNISYKNFTLYFLFDIKSGGDVYNRKSQWLTRDNRNGIMDMGGKAASEKKAYDYYQAFYDVNTNNSYWVEDASFVKLRELAIGYTVKGSALPGLSKVVKTMNARIIGRNLLTFTKYTGYDPEVGSIRSPFDDTGSYPNYRNVAFSLSFDF